MYAFLLSTAVIFVAELGDKSQLMAMTFATRYRARDVLLGITVATALVHLASVGIGLLHRRRLRRVPGRDLDRRRRSRSSPSRHGRCAATS